GPATVARVEAPHRAVIHRVGAGLVAVAEQPAAKAVTDHVVWAQPGGLAGHRLPAGAGVVGTVQRGLLRRNTRIDRARRTVTALAVRFEIDEGHTNGLRTVPTRRRRRLCNGRKRLHF